MTAFPTKRLLAGAACWLGCAAALPAAEAYFGRTTMQAVLSAQPLSGSASVVAASGVAGEASGGGIRLVASSLCATVATPEGYVNFAPLTMARVEIEGTGTAPGRTVGAAEYRYGMGQNGSASLWNIQFPGIPNYQATQQISFPPSCRRR